MTRSVDLLYIHPNGHLNDLVIPTGALSCLNSTSVSKLGRYSFEVQDQEIRDAGVVALDVHWALALSNLEPLLSRIRDLRPDVPLVVGGITAGHYSTEILRRFPIDYVVRGDSEAAFADLVAALCAGRDPSGIPNVASRDCPNPRQQRLTSQQFDATDCITADWFPTYESCSNWDAAAFPQGRTIPVARGCPYRCPECYGSFASTFGPGVLLRSPARLSELLARAEAIGARNVRLFIGKPPANELRRWLGGLASAGPFRFRDTVGIYLCTAPTPADLDDLEAGFGCPVTISMLPPTEHVPRIDPETLAEEQEAWRRVADRVRRSRRLNLDVWTSRSDQLEQLRHDLMPQGSARVSVAYAAVWSITRPVDAEDSPTFDDVSDAVAPTWTFYAARLLSPSLARLLSPFAFLDELDRDPETVACPSKRLRDWHAAIMESWGRHRLPYLSGLQFAAVPLSGQLPAPVSTTPQQIRLHGDLCFVSGDVIAGAAPDLDGASLLVPKASHKGVTLSASFQLPGTTTAIAVVPVMDGDLSASYSTLSPDGLIGMMVRDLPAGEVTLDLHLRVQEAQVALLNGHGDSIGRGRAEMAYFRPTASATSPSSELGSSRELCVRLQQDFPFLSIEATYDQALGLLYQVQVVLTARCNERCPFCQAELSPSEHGPSEQVLRQCFERVTARLPHSKWTLTGGEPTLRADLVELVHALVSSETVENLTVQTNAVDIGRYPERFSFPSTAKLSFLVGFHGTRDALYDRCTGTRGLLPDAIRGIRDLLNQGFRLELNCVVSAINVDHLEQLVRDCTELFGASERLNVHFSVMALSEMRDVTELIVPFSQFSSEVERALECAEQAGLRASVAISAHEMAIPPCLLSERLLAASEYPHVYLHEDVSADRSAQWQRGQGCDACRYSSSCLGLPKAYVEKLGLDELRPE